MISSISYLLSLLKRYSHILMPSLYAEFHVSTSNGEECQITIKYGMFDIVLLRYSPKLIY